MDIYPKSKIALADVKRFIIIFYIVGFFGFIIPFTKELFIVITPVALLLNTYLLIVYHQKISLKDILIFFLIFLSGYFIEVVGVRTGLIFGPYVYGKALGIKLFETPLLIGVNWLFLTYTASTLTDYLNVKKWLSVFISPLFMLVYDLILEQVAPKLNMWSWDNSIIPFKNFMAWYIIALVFSFLLKIFKIETRNPLGVVLFLSQFVFFLLLSVFL